MNMDRIINMIIRRVLGRIIGMGVNKGFEAAGKGFDSIKNRTGKQEDPAPQPRQPQENAQTQFDDDPDDLQAFGLFDADDPAPRKKRKG